MTHFLHPPCLQPKVVGWAHSLHRVLHQLQTGEGGQSLTPPTITGSAQPTAPSSPEKGLLRPAQRSINLIFVVFFLAWQCVWFVRAEPGFGGGMLQGGG